MYALMYELGLPSVFWTFAPDDVHNHVSVRFFYRVKTNDGFPAESTEEFMRCFEKGEVYQGYENVDIKLDTG